MEVTINWLAVLTAGFANMAIGFAWYSDSLFGKEWRKLIGMSESDAKPKGSDMTKMMVLGLGSAFVMAWVLAHSTIFAGSYMGTSGITLGLATGFFNWLGYMFPILISAHLYERKPLKLVFINSGYWLASLLVMGVIIAVWK